MFYGGNAVMNTIDSAAPVPPIPAKAIWALSLAAFASGISLRLTDPMLPRLVTEFNISLASASYVITCFSVAYGLSQLFFGPLGDHFGKYRVIAWGCIACAFTASLCWLAPSFPFLLAARLLAGATAASLIPLSMAWIGDVIPYHRRQPVLARFLIGQIIGLSTGVLVGGFTADHLNWRTPFLGLTIIFAAVAMILLALNRRLPAHAKTVHQATGHVFQRTVGEFRQVIATRWARVVLATVFLEGLFLYGSFAFITSHLHHVHRISLSRAGLIVMLFGFGGVLFATSATLLVKRLGEAGLCKWGGIFIGLSLATIGLAPTWHWAVPGCFFTGLGFYMFHNTLQINATQMAPERRGAAVSAFASCFFLGQSLGVASIGLLAEQAGTAAAMTSGAAGVLIVAINFSRLRAAATHASQ